MKGLNWVQIRNDRHKGLSYTEIGRNKDNVIDFVARAAARKKNIPCA
ncbi:MAG: hypothetical protein GYA36_08805 [Veillonellaceae bacterium]|nr:hypothetical protein [Veillonellaceae bacterium]